MKNIEYVQDAFDAFNGGDPVRALSLVKRLNKNKLKQTFTSLEFEGALSYLLGKYKKACDVYVVALRLAETDFQKITAYERLGKSYLALGMDQDAKDSFEKGIQIDACIDNVESVFCLSQLCLGGVQLDRAKELALQLLQFEAYFVKAQVIIIKCADLKKDTLAAEQSLSAVIDFFLVKDHLTQEDGVDVSNFLPHLINSEKLVEAEKLILKAELLLGACQGLDAYKALIEAKAHPDASPVEYIPNSLLKNINLIPSIKLDLYFARAKLFDRQGDYDSAWADFTSLGLLKKATLSDNRYVDMVKTYQKANVATLSADKGYSPGYKPVFLVGFPRSGTTLLDTILDTQETIRTLSETESLAQVVKSFVYDLKLRYPSDLESISIDELNCLRGVYARHVNCLIGDVEESDLVVDKMPLNMIHIPLIISLFPTAKFLFCLRHPLDVCLSSFQQHFSDSPEMNRLLTIDKCFERYKQVFDLFSVFQERFDFQMYTVRYENLVSHYDEEVMAIFDFLKIEATDAYKSFHLHAKNLRIATPSANQVRQPIYQSSKEKWKHYGKYLKPYVPLVQAYIDQFGYEA